MNTLPSSITLPNGGRVDFAHIGREVDVWRTDASGDVVASVRVSPERARELADAAGAARG